MKKHSLIFKRDELVVLDQTKLPLKVEYLKIISLEQAFKAIKSLKVRGAPLIGVFAGYSLYLSLKNRKFKSKREFFKHLNKDISYLKTSRPTAVNLSWALDRIKRKAEDNSGKNTPALKEIIKKEAKAIHREDILLCRKIAESGIKLINPGDRILTHCNAGFLATSGEGTALSIIYEARRKYGSIKVYADETRPLLQGARLTAWELLFRRVDVTLICDNMAAYLMKMGKIDKIIVGADRIASNGDTANKIGTYNLAVLAKHHKIPFYVAAPSSSFDLSLDKGEDIPIELRDEREIRFIQKKQITPLKVPVWNPAFDLTPAGLITCLITEKGIISQPLKANIERGWGRPSKCGKSLLS